jgi:hypothetical protein
VSRLGAQGESDGSFVAISTDARSAFVEKSQRFVDLRQEALDFIPLVLARIFLEPVK